MNVGRRASCASCAPLLWVLNLSLIHISGNLLIGECIVQIGTDGFFVTLHYRAHVLGLSLIHISRSYHQPYSMDQLQVQRLLLPPYWPASEYNVSFCLHPRLVSVSYTHLRADGAITYHLGYFTLSEVARAKAVAVCPEGKDGLPSWL